MVSAVGTRPEPRAVSPKPAKAVSPSRTAAITRPGAPEPRKAIWPAKATDSSSSASAAAGLPAQPMAATRRNALVRAAVI